MCRNPLPLALLFVFCAMGSSTVVAQQSGTSGNGESASGATGLSVEGPQMITGEQMRASVQPGQVIGAAGAGAGMLRGAVDATGQTGRAAGNTGRQQGRNTNALLNAMNNFGMFNSMSNQRRQIRIPISLGFTPTTLPTSPVVGARVEDRLTKIPQLRNRATVSVEMDGRVAVLRGGVASSHERELVARLVLLEPGISGVQNELQVLEAAATP